MFTLANGICGFSAIVAAAASANPSNNSTTCLIWSVGLILLAMLLDAVDGWIARKLGATSDIGAQLDSLCDAVSFGVAPAFIMFNACTGGAPIALLWIAGAVYTGCAIFRLARFNVQTEDHSADSHRWFTGLPSPAAAALVLFMVTMRICFPPESTQVTSQVCYVVVEITLLAALVMVSRTRFPHLSQVIRMLKGKGAK